MSFLNINVLRGFLLVCKREGGGVTGADDTGADDSDAGGDDSNTGGDASNTGGEGGPGCPGGDNTIIIGCGDDGDTGDVVGADGDNVTGDDTGGVGGADGEATVT